MRPPVTADYRATVSCRRCGRTYAVRLLAEACEHWYCHRTALGFRCGTFNAWDETQCSTPRSSSLP